MVPARDAQAILGRAHIPTTQQICTDVDEASRLEAVTRLNELLSRAGDRPAVVSRGVSTWFRDRPRDEMPGIE